MNKTSIILSIISGFTFLLLIGCNKENKNYDYIPEQIKQYSVFQLGSYWVYKNEATGKLDSSYLAVSPYISYSHIYSDPQLRIEEKYDISFGGEFLNTASIRPSQYSIGFKHNYGSVCIYDNINPSYSLTSDYYSSFKNLNLFDSMVVNNEIYHQVLNTQYKSWTHNGDTSIWTYYFAKSVGLIKVTMGKNHQDTTWSLLRYHVIL